MKRWRGLRKGMRSALTTLLSRRCHQHSIHFDLILALLTSYAELEVDFRTATAVGHSTFSIDSPLISPLGWPLIKWLQSEK